MTTVYNQVIPMNARVIDGCDDELILGKNFLLQKNAVIDFETCDVKYREGDETIIVFFSCAGSLRSANGIRAIRAVRWQQMASESRTIIKVLAAAREGSDVWFLPHLTKHECHNVLSWIACG